tara:strand:- start:1283 stop:1414 length:132 start_codon:yes stop_codon:yes gene_type:complete
MVAKIGEVIRKLTEEGGLTVLLLKQTLLFARIALRLWIGGEGC